MASATWALSEALDRQPWAASSSTDEPLPSATSVPSPIPSEPVPPSYSLVPVLGCFLATLVLVLGLINYFGDRRRVRWYVQVVTVISWYFPFTIMFLLPVDLGSTLYRQCSNAGTCESDPVMYLDEKAQLITWRVIYWTSFGLTWFCLPFLISFVDSGAFRLRDRVVASIRDNIIYYGIAAAVGLAVLVYVIAVLGIANMAALTAFVMAAANSWGLVLIIGFMGCGLVALPRRFWHMADLGREYRSIESKASTFKDNWFMAEMDLLDLLKQTMDVDRKMSVASELRPFIDTIMKKFPQNNHRHIDETSTSNVPEVVTEKYLIGLHLNVMRALSREARCRALWEQQLRNALLYQDILANRHNPNRCMESTLPPYRDAPRWKRVLAWWWYLVFRPTLFRGLAVVFAVFSAALIWSELTFNVAHPQLSIFAHIMHSLNLSYAALEFVSFFTMAYMCACAYTMLMKVDLFHIYALAPNHQTNERSLLFCGSYLCRLTMPLCYNYLTLSRAMDGPVYSQFMGQIDLVPFLGDAFNAWFPILILLPALFTLFRVHSRIFQLFDASDALDGDESGTSLQIEEGRNLIEEARKAMERSGTLQAVVGPGGPAARYDSARRHRARFVPRNQRSTGADPMHDPNGGSGQPTLVSTNHRTRTRQDRSGSRTYLLRRSETSTPASLSEQDGSDSELLSSARSEPPGNPQPSLHSRTQTLANSNEASPTVFQRGWQWLRRQVPSAASSARPFPGTDADSQPLAPQPTGLPSSTSACHPDPDDQVYDWESGQYLRRSHPNPWATETSASGVSSVSGGPTNPPRNIFDGL